MADNAPQPEPQLDPDQTPEPPGPYVLFPQPPITEDDVRRANELIEKYGLQHLRHQP